MNGRNNCRVIDSHSSEKRTLPFVPRQSVEIRRGTKYGAFATSILLTRLELIRWFKCLSFLPGRVASSWGIITAMRTLRLLPVVLSLSLLLSAVGPLLRTDCSRSDLNSHTPADHNSTGMHSHTSTHGEDRPCEPNGDSAPAEPVPCPQHAAACCAFQAVPSAKMATVLFESPRSSSGEQILSRLPDTLSEVDSRASLFRPLSARRFSACLPSSDRQAIHSTFLI